MYGGDMKKKQNSTPLTAWEQMLLRRTERLEGAAASSAKAKLREVRRLRISEAARRNDMTYNQFMSAVREWDPMVGSAAFLGDQDPGILDRFAKAAKNLLVDIAK